MLATIRKVREADRRVVLVTGRILRELLADFPDAPAHFDAIVAENGGVLFREGRERALAAPTSTALERRLAAEGIPLRRGLVILATQIAHDPVVRRACMELGLDHQLVRNRFELMVLPAAVSKGTGLREAFAELGVSYHSAVGIGDAENDLALHDACEIAIAVRDSVPSLKEQADLVLDTAGPDAVATFLAVEVLRGIPGVQPRRRRIELGVDDQEREVSIPGSRTQVLIDGPSGTSKSYVAGLFAEGLVRAGYSVCVLDMEGEHVGLGDLRGVLSTGGREPLPPLDQVARLVRHRFGSVVIDLSLRERSVQHAYCRDLLECLTSVRRECGLPHWIFIEEAHVVPAAILERARERGSLCLVTYRPDWMSPTLRETADVHLTMEAKSRACLQLLGAPPRYFVPAPRQIAHVRHHRKYADSCVPYERGFTFREGAGDVGIHVVCLTEFCTALGSVSRAALAHHAGHRDFSRWIRDVFQDRDLASSIRHAEEQFHASDADGFRLTLRHLLTTRIVTERPQRAGRVVDSDARRLGGDDAKPAGTEEGA